METDVFEFRIINLADGTQVIDGTLKTPHEALTPLQMVEYIEMDAQLAYMDRLKRKQRAEAERRRMLTRNPFYRLACICRLV